MLEGRLKAVSRPPLLPGTAQARFQAVTAAYDALRRNQPLDAAPGEPERPRADFHGFSTAMWRAKQRRRAELNAGMVERRLMLSAVVVVSDSVDGVGRLDMRREVHRLWLRLLRRRIRHEGRRSICRSR